MNIFAKIGISLFAMALCGCETRQQPNYFQQALKQNQANRQAANQRLGLYQSQITPLIEACDRQHEEIRYDRAVCRGNAQLNLANELGLRPSSKSIIAEGVALQLEYAKKIDSGSISKEEAEALYKIDILRLTQNRINQSKQSNAQALNRLRSRTRDFPRDTTCSKFGDMINCTTW